jgi:hypothetical protein
VDVGSLDVAERPGTSTSWTLSTHATLLPGYDEGLQHVADRRVGNSEEPVRKSS